jgi:hypothetical protein
MAPEFGQFSRRKIVHGVALRGKRSKPIGFYTWTPELTAIFPQDRFSAGRIAFRADLRTMQDLASLKFAMKQ